MKNMRIVRSKDLDGVRAYIRTLCAACLQRPWSVMVITGHDVMPCCEECAKFYSETHKIAIEDRLPALKSS